MFRKLDNAISVSPQITPGQLADAAAQGVTLVINNRPDDEQPGQPSGAEIAAATAQAGLDYRAIPVTHAGFSHTQIDAMADALENANGPVLAYCRSGTRSTLLWALARAKLGDDKTELAAKAKSAGYDLAPVAAMLDMVAGR